MYYHRIFQLLMHTYIVMGNLPDLNNNYNNNNIYINSCTTETRNKLKMDTVKS